MQNQVGKQIQTQNCFNCSQCLSSAINAIITICLLRNCVQVSKPEHPVTTHVRSHMNNSSSCPTVISKHSKAMDKNTRASRSCIHHYFLVFGYPGETLALVVIYCFSICSCLLILLLILHYYMILYFYITDLHCVYLYTHFCK